jgi:hypothetical protein
VLLSLCQKDSGANLKSFSWTKMRQFEHQKDRNCNRSGQ